MLTSRLASSLCMCDRTSMLASLCLLLVGLDQKDSYTVMLWPRLASTTTAACSSLVMLVFMHLRCVPSACRQAGDAWHHAWFCGSVRGRRRHRQLHTHAGFAGCDASAVAGVARIALCFLRCRQAHDARHHGRYDQKDFLQRHSGRPSTWTLACAWLVLLVFMHPMMCSLMFVGRGACGGHACRRRRQLRVHGRFCG